MPSTPGAGEDVTLLTPGDEPRRAMRYVFHPGSKERMTMQMRMTMAMTAGDRHPPPVTMPAMVIGMGIDARRLTPEGNLVQGFAIESVDVAKDSTTNPKLREALERDLPKMVGLSGEAETTVRGQTLNASVVVPPNVGEQVASLLDQMRRQIRELTVSFPAQPVGRGAKWSVVNTARMNKMTVTRTANYTLSQSDGDRGTLDVGVIMSAPAQDVGEAQGPRVHLESMSGEGHGTVKFDLQRLVPTSDMDLAIDIAMSVEAQGTKQPLAMSTKLGIHIEGAK